ncbi:hypothetical protein JWG39_06035 [Desulforhopalus vacuolatus]|uniref:hypothetical protein n=1 Tax=Desulforhopalus vacuolatus TaxID=40414 RepID=UPI001963A9D3|nr:hypothetical protein [Desulforhopalus vacuolatus]MBM9519382.1 hypothetical protein [Desulforhopalus vacuolatus]
MSEYKREEYDGTLPCAGECGNLQVYEALMEACFELKIPPHRVARFTTINCAAAPACFLGQSCGVAAPPGLLASMAIGSCTAGNNLLTICISDGENCTPGILLNVLQSGVHLAWIHLPGDGESNLPSCEIKSASCCGRESGRLVEAIKRTLRQPGFSYLEIVAGDICELPADRTSAEAADKAAVEDPVSPGNAVLQQINETFRMAACRLPRPGSGKPLGQEDS